LSGGAPGGCPERGRNTAVRLGWGRISLGFARNPGRSPGSEQDLMRQRRNTTAWGSSLPGRAGCLAFVTMPPAEPEQVCPGISHRMSAAPTRPTGPRATRASFGGARPSGGRRPGECAREGTALSFFQAIRRTALAAALVTALSLGALAPSARGAQGLLVVSRSNGRVLHYDGSTGAFKGVFLSAGAGGLSQVSDLTLGPDGKLYVGSTGGVLRFDASTGAFIDSFVSGLAQAPIALCFGPDGNLYGTVGKQWFKADGTTGALLGTFGGGGLSFSTGIAFGPDGNLYVGSWLSNQVLRFNPATGAFIDVFATVPIAG